MAVTAQKSDQITLTENTPSEKVSVNQWSGKKRIAYFSFTQSGAGDANSTVDLVKLPAGPCRVILTESYLAGAAFGASRTLDIGYPTYVGNDGEDVAADVDAILDGRDVSAASGAALTAAAGADPTVLLNSKAGVTIQAKVLGGTIPTGTVLYGYLTYVKE